MDFGKNDLKTLTDTLKEVLQAHTAAVKDGMKSSDLLHGKVVEGLMWKIQSYQQPTATQPKETPVSTQAIEVLHGAPEDIKPVDQSNPNDELPAEGAKDRSQAQTPESKAIAQQQATDETIIPHSDQPNTPPVKPSQRVPKTPERVIKPLTQPKVVTDEQVTADNIDALSQSLVDEKLEEPVITGVKGK